MVAAITAIPAIVTAGSIQPNAAQAGGTCIAYSDGRRVANYSCDFERDSRGRVTLIEWEHGTASVNLGGWSRVSANCFAASENAGWQICASGYDCEDVKSLQIAVRVYRTTPAGGETIWRSSNNVVIIQGAAKLNGISGDLYTYDVQGTRIKNFIGSAGSTNLYSFDGSAWIPTAEKVKSGNMDISRLAPNNLGITKENYTETTTIRRVCR